MVAEASRSADVLSEDLLETGWAIAAALARWQQWSHRKVESIDLLEGSRGRRRVSIDFTSPGVLWRTDEDLDAVEIVPLTFLKKETLRGFDLRDESGGSVSLLPAESNGLLAAATLAALISGERSLAEAKAAWPQLVEITTALASEAEGIAGELILELQTSVFTSALMRDLARNFLLIAAIEPGQGRLRQILKFSYHWDTDSASGPRRSRIRAALGFGSADLGIEMSSLDSAASFHLECTVPSGLVCKELALPVDVSGTRPVDRSGSVIAHARGRYEWDQAKNPAKARIRLMADPGELAVRVMWSALVVSAIFVCLLFIPGSLTSLRDHMDPAVTVLVFLPAFVIVLGARGTENKIVTRVLWPLRICAYVLAFLLVFTGALLVLSAPWWLVTACWWVSACASGALFLTLVISQLWGRTRRAE